MTESDREVVDFDALKFAIDTDELELLVDALRQRAIKALHGMDCYEDLKSFATQDSAAHRHVARFMVRAKQLQLVLAVTPEDPDDDEGSDEE